MQIVRIVGILVGALLLALLVWFFVITAPPAEEPSTPAPRESDEQHVRGEVSFTYPQDLATTYIHPVTWPPTVTVTDGPIACTPQDSGQKRIREVELAASTYCVTETIEGAAGSIYTDYVYQTIKDDRTITIAFSLRMSQCANYSAPEAQACTIEREQFSPDALAAQIFQTIELSVDRN